MPATKLAEELGISGRRLGKDERFVSIFRCLRAAIGRRGRKTILRTPLPRAKPNSDYRQTAIHLCQKKMLLSVGLAAPTKFVSIRR